MNQKRTLTFKSAFILPMVFIFILMMISKFLIEGMREAYILQIAGSAFLEESRNGVFFLGGAIFLILITLAKRVDLHRIILTVFMAFPLLIIFFACVLVPWIPEGSSSNPLVKFWPLTGYYVITSYWMTGSFFFFWAFANNHFSFRQAGYYYPIILMIVSFLTVYIQNPLTNAFNSIHPLPSRFALINSFVFALGLAIFSLYYTISRIIKNVPHEQDARGDKISRLFGLNYLVTIGFMSLTVGYITGVFPPSLYPADHTWQLGTLFILAFASISLYYYRGKGWRYWAYIVSISVVFTFSFSWAKNQKEFFDVMMKSSLAPFVLILKEMTFIAVPQANRFLTKTWVDMFFMGLGVLLAPYATTALTLIILIGYLIATHLAGKKLETFAPFKNQR